MLPRVGSPSDSATARVTQCTLVDHNGGTLACNELLGVRWGVLLLPGAFTPVCTRELPGIQALWRSMGARGIPIVVVTCDTPPVLAAWRRAEGIEMALHSDFWPHGRLCRALDAFDERTGCSRRSSAVIDPDGSVRWQETAAPGEVRDLDRLAAALADR